MDSVKKIRLDQCHSWILGDELHHTSHRYFSITLVLIDGVENLMIRQEEIGILGTLTSIVEDQRYFLVQYKPEPGNIPFYQWAPSVQATLSNYERVHQGKATKFLDYFISVGENDVISSEQGDRFYNKFNRNSLKEIETAFQVNDESFKWKEINELKDKLSKSYQVNTDLRSVIASGDWAYMTNPGEDLFSSKLLPARIRVAFQRSMKSKDPAHLKNILEEKSSLDSEVSWDISFIPLKSSNQFSILPEGIDNKKGERVVEYFDVSLPVREVPHWAQPLYCKSKIDFCNLCFSIKEGVAKFYLSIYSEPGYKNRVEFGPTFQSGVGSEKISIDHYKELAKGWDTILSIEQTDEGGRFYRNVCNYELSEIKDQESFKLDEKNGVWVTLSELQELCKMQSTLTNELRTCISILLSMA